MPVTMSKILILVPLVRLRRIILRVARSVRGDNRRTLIEIQCDVAFEMNRNGQVISGRKVYRAANGRRRRIDRFVNGRSIKGLAVSGSTEGFHVVGRGISCGSGKRNRQPCAGNESTGDGKTGRNN